MNYGPIYPSIIDNAPHPEDAYGGVAWSDEQNLIGNDDADAQVSLSSETMFSRALKATGFGFAIPTGKTILGVKVEVEAFGTDAQFAMCRLLVNGSPVGQNKGDFDPSLNVSPTWHTFGGPAVTWSASLDATKVNASNFGVVLAFVSSSSAVVKVRRVRITVYVND